MKKKLNDEKGIGKTNKLRKKYYFFLNPYTDAAFTKCPKCETKTKIRKYCLLVHIEPSQLVSLNKTCRYCPYCDLIIAKKEEIESLLQDICKEYFPELEGKDYFIFGTLDRGDWKKFQEEETYPKESLEKAYIFKNVWIFKPAPMVRHPVNKESNNAKPPKSKNL